MEGTSRSKNVLFFILQISKKNSPGLDDEINLYEPKKRENHPGFDVLDTVLVFKNTQTFTFNDMIWIYPPHPKFFFAQGSLTVGLKRTYLP